MHIITIVIKVVFFLLYSFISRVLIGGYLNALGLQMDISFTHIGNYTKITRLNAAGYRARAF